jgi:tetrahydromethanopterin S-methyltransferase subunit G
MERRFEIEMDYEKEMNDLTKRIDELETCCAEFRACKGKIGERIDKLEHRLDDLRSEVKTLYNVMERDSAGLR